MSMKNKEKDFNKSNKKCIQKQIRTSNILVGVSVASSKIP